ncbi:hypothetical protein ASD15_01465 [Massilia sp. Root351]|nr:hypothetical protein ASD15_01465 [Massilia sp. Root351]
MCAAAACIFAAAPGLASSAVTAAPAALAADRPLPAASFFQPPAVSAAALSPGGHFLAIREAGPKRQQVSVIDLRDNSRTVAARFADADVGEFRWVNDERLLFTAGNRYAERYSERYAPGLFAVNRDGSGYRQLAARTSRAVRSETATRLLPWHTFMLDDAGAQDSDWVYVADVRHAGAGYGYSARLLKLDTVTGDRQEIDSPPGVARYLLDAQGEPRLGVAGTQGDTGIYYRQPATGKWEVVASFKTFTGSEDSFDPLVFLPNGKLLARANRDNDKSGVYVFDPDARQLLDKRWLALPGRDFEGEFIVGKNGVRGLRYAGDDQGMWWDDAALSAMQKAIDSLLPDTRNLVELPARAATAWVLVQSFSDRQPAVYSVFNTGTGALVRVAESRPAMAPQQMGTQRMVRYKARDGLDIPALLTLPAGQAAQLPLVVLVHGGPAVRGTLWGWNAETQFLASRGYAVLEPEYRGSTGNGYAHYRAGWQQWGLKMQDDIADGASWAVGQGIADGKRICIAGGSYGGYAALMGLVNDPQLFKCGIAWAAVTDIQLLYDGHWRFNANLSKDFQQYGMPTLLGDPVTHAEQFKATSPLQQAARITQPLLLAYGDDDRRVLPVHGERLRKALRAAGNQQVEWIEYEDEEHGWSKPATRVDFWTRVEQFLGRHIGPRQAAPAKE